MPDAVTGSPQFDGEGPQPDDPGKGAHARLARVTTGVIIGLVLLMAGVIYWRGAFTHVPTTAMVINGDPSLDGATVAVRGIEDSGRQVDLSILLSRDNGYRTPVLLNAGQYRVSVVHHGQMILNELIALQNMKPIGFNLPTAISFQGGAEVGDVRVDVVSVAGVYRPHRFELNGADRYRFFTHLFAGNYHLTARKLHDPAAVVRTLDFTLDHGSAAHIDLNRPADPDGSIAQ